MKTYKFHPGNCYNEQGITYRPFFIDDVEVYRMNIEKMLSSKEDSNKEMVALCEVIRQKTGLIVSVGELPELIKNKKIVVENG